MKKIIFLFICSVFAVITLVVISAELNAQTMTINNNQPITISCVNIAKLLCTSSQSCPMNNTLPLAIGDVDFQFITGCFTTPHFTMEVTDGVDTDIIVHCGGPAGSGILPTLGISYTFTYIASDLIINFN